MTDAASTGARVPPPRNPLVRPAAERELGAFLRPSSVVDRGHAALLRHFVGTLEPGAAGFPFAFGLRVELEGERVIAADPELGYGHRGLEHAWHGQVLHAWVREAPAISPRHPALWQVLALRAHAALTGRGEPSDRVICLQRACIALETVLSLGHQLAVLAALSDAPHLSGHLSSAVRTLARDGACLRGPHGTALLRRAAGLGIAAPHDDVPGTLPPLAMLEPGLRALDDAVDAVLSAPSLVARWCDVGRLHPTAVTTFALSGPIAAGMPRGEPAPGQSGDVLSRAAAAERALHAAHHAFKAAYEPLAGRAPPAPAQATLEADVDAMPPGLPAAATVRTAGPCGEASLTVRVRPDARDKVARARVLPASTGATRALPQALRGARFSDVPLIVTSLFLDDTALDR